VIRTFGGMISEYQVEQMPHGFIGQNFLFRFHIQGSYTIVPRDITVSSGGLDTNIDTLVEAAQIIDIAVEYTRSPGLT
jgi:hypothetical protein